MQNDGGKKKSEGLTSQRCIIQSSFEQEVGEMDYVDVMERDMQKVWAVEDAAQIGTSIEACQDAAWAQIKDRRGRMVNGVFVKEGER